MGEPPDWVDHYRRVYTAASQMMWLQHGTRVWRGTRWPEDRRAAWVALEETLTRTAEAVVASLDGFDPAHHLLSRRDLEGRPITFAEAAADWQRRITEDPGPTIGPKENGYYGITPGGGVILSPSWQSHVRRNTIEEMEARLAPGRPPVTIAAEARPLAEVLHDLAAAYRAPLPGQDPDPAPTRALPAAQGARALDAVVSRADYEQLCARARAAAEAMPSRTEVKRDFSVNGYAVDAAGRVLRILEGEDAPDWQEFPEETDPARHAVDESVETWTLATQAEWLSGVFRTKAMPRPPHDHEVLEDYDHPVEPTDQDRLVPMSPAIAQVMAEVLDEFAARVTPDQHIGRLLFDAYPLCVFLRRFDTRLQKL